MGEKRPHLIFDIFPILIYTLLHTQSCDVLHDVLRVGVNQRKRCRGRPGTAKMVMKFQCWSCSKTTRMPTRRTTRKSCPYMHYQRSCLAVSCSVKSVKLFASGAPTPQGSVADRRLPESNRKASPDLPTVGAIQRRWQFARRRGTHTPGACSAAWVL